MQFPSQVPNEALLADVVFLSIYGLAILVMMIGIAYVHPLSAWNKED